MQCRTHPDHNGVNTCNQCGEWLCEACTVEINGRIFCRRCLAQIASEGTAPERPREIPRAAYPVPAAARHINWGLLFFFSCVIPIPGLNYMYEGLIKRGLAAMSGFFLLVYLMAQFHAWPLSLIFGLSFPVYMLACIFDGFHIRRRINAGEAVSDDVDDILNFFKRNKRLIISLLVLVLALTLVNTLFGAFYLPFPLKRYLPVIIIGLGLYILFKRPTRRP